MTPIHNDSGAVGDATLQMPLSAERLVPHRLPMRLVGTLVSRDGENGVTESRIPVDAVVADSQGRLDETTLVELIAQSYAAVAGHLGLSTGTPPKMGFLVGIRDCRITAPAYAGEPLLTSVRTVAAHGGFAVVDGTVTRDGETLAVCTLTLWIPEPPATSAT
jgi:predicted hotdog family 3-hydroxylacyl-ACP dehydratase